MTLQSKILDEMIINSKLNHKELYLLGCKFWISKEYTEYPNNHLGIQIIKTNILNEDFIYLCTEENFILKHL